jgi:inhibitor of KinA
MSRETTASDPSILRVAAAGDAALLLEFPPRIDPEINARAIAVAAALQRRCGTALRDAVIGYHTVTAYFDPLAVDARWMESEMRAAAAEINDPPVRPGAIVEVPVCYGGDLGPDMGDVARFGACSEEDVVAIHSGQTYRVYMVGFVPGFAYMAEVDSRIAAPRRAVPRTSVPIGAVAIAGGQTGIYPAATPGGWNIIGRTPLKAYDPARAEPFLFRAGDAVRFHPIDRGEFDRA